MNATQLRPVARIHHADGTEVTAEFLDGISYFDDPDLGDGTVLYVLTSPPATRTPVVHQGPLRDDGMLRCCGRSPLAMPAGDRLATLQSMVTCEAVR